jgi:hypothetical protein
MYLVRPGCTKRCQGVVKVNIMSSDLIAGYLTLDLNQPIKWADFRLDALLADTMATGPECFFVIPCEQQLLIELSINSGEFW